MGNAILAYLSRQSGTSDVAHLSSDTFASQSVGTRLIVLTGVAVVCAVGGCRRATNYVH